MFDVELPFGRYIGDIISVVDSQLVKHSRPSLATQHVSSGFHEPCNSWTCCLLMINRTSTEHNSMTMRKSMSKTFTVSQFLNGMTSKNLKIKSTSGGKESQICWQNLPLGPIDQSSNLIKSSSSCLQVIFGRSGSWYLAATSPFGITRYFQY